WRSQATSLQIGGFREQRCRLRTTRRWIAPKRLSPRFCALNHSEHGRWGNSEGIIDCVCSQGLINDVLAEVWCGEKDGTRFGPFGCGDSGGKGRCGSDHV